MTGTGTILSFDVATVAGWATAAGSARPLYGSHRIVPAGTPIPDACLATLRWAGTMIDQHRPETVVIEEPMVISRTGADIVIRLTGMAVAVAMAARERGVVVHFYQTATVTKAFVGQARFHGGSKEKKSRVMQQCRLYGWNPLNDNEGDALALLHYAQSVLGRGAVERAAGPLFHDALPAGRGPAPSAYPAGTVQEREPF